METEKIGIEPSPSLAGVEVNSTTSLVGGEHNSRGNLLEPPKPFRYDHGVPIYGLTYRPEDEWDN